MILMICEYSYALTGEFNVTQTESTSIVHVWNVNATDIDEQMYTIRLMNKNKTLFDGNGSSTFKIPSKLLKPCTEYTVQVDGCQLRNGTIHFECK